MGCGKSKWADDEHEAWWEKRKEQLQSIPPHQLNELFQKIDEVVTAFDNGSLGSLSRYVERLKSFSRLLTPPIH